MNNNMSDRFLRKLMNTAPDFSKGECRVTFDVGRGMLIEGVRTVRGCSDDRIVLSTCSKTLTIEGRGLCICRMFRTSMVICGTITSVSFS